MPELNRREFARECRDWMILTTAGFSLTQLEQAQFPLRCHAAEETTSAPLAPLNRFPRMLQDYYAARFREHAAVSEQRWAKLTSRTAAEEFVADRRSTIRQSIFGTFPPRTPLRPRCSGIIQREGYTIEKVLFDSRPDFPVTANLYLPQQRGPLPAVVISCGHSANGKAYETYQSLAQGLCRLGFVALILDPIGQGERLQYVDESGQPMIGSGVNEHLRVGQQLLIVGDHFAAWRAWDALRALDYLETRPEVDPRRIAITGNSGGGTMTMWLAALDDRWSMAAPCCAVTSFRRNFENELPTDSEQCPPRVLELGLEHADFLAALAPRPLLIVAQEGDYFDVRGTEETFARLSALYRLLGAEQHLQLYVGQRDHGLHQDSREAVYHFFRTHSQANLQTAKIAASTPEPALTLEAERTLQVLPRGYTSTLFERSVPKDCRERAQQLRISRPHLPTAEIPAQLRHLLQLSPLPPTPPSAAILRPNGPRGYPLPHATTYLIETEPGIQLPLLRLSDKPRYSRPPQTALPCFLYVAHQSSDLELRQDRFVADQFQAHPQAVWYAVDLRGIGDSRPDTCGPNMANHPYGSDYFYAAQGVMFSRPMPAQRTWDLLRIIDWLIAAGHPHVSIAARGQGTIPATFAAVLHPHIESIQLMNSLDSYERLLEDRSSDWPLSACVPGFLRTMDLPDCYRYLTEQRHLQRLND